MFYIGSHISSAKGYEAMGKQALKLGAGTFAFFTRNPRGGSAKAIDPADVERFQGIARENEFGKIVAHAPYTLNACSDKADTRRFAGETFRDDLKRMEYTPGCRRGNSPDQRDAERFSVSGHDHHGASGDHGRKGQRGGKKL